MKKLNTKKLAREMREAALEYFIDSHDNYSGSIDYQEDRFSQIKFEFKDYIDMLTIAHFLEIGNIRKAIDKMSNMDTVPRDNIPLHILKLLEKEEF